MQDVYVDVLLPLSLSNTFTYRATQFSENLAIGKRVLINFGKNKFYSALIYNIHQQRPQGYIIKDVLSILDTQPIVNKVQLEFWKWIANYYMCSIGEVMAAALPSVFQLSSETLVAIHPDFNGDISSLNHQEIAILELLEQQKTANFKDISKTLGNVYVMSQVRNMIDKSLLILCEDIEEKFRQRQETFIELSTKYQNDESALSQLFNDLEKSKKTHQQADALLAFLALCQQKGIQKLKKSELLLQSSITESRLSSLIKKGILNSCQMPVSRWTYHSNTNEVDNIQLSTQQNTAFQSILNSFQEKNSVLLHGVTGSGKTEIYIKLIQHYINQDKQILYLLPEIALTEQIINRLRAYFGDNVGIYHSKYNPQQRAEIWQEQLKKQNKRFKIILGTRSAIFLPFDNLGLIIVDEEHDSSYKQFDPAPRYNARDAAMILAQKFKAKVLLGSATPCLESYYNAKINKYAYISLNERFGGLQLPQLELIDIKKASFAHQMKSHYSQQLLDKIQETLDKNQQVILFQNRRGFSLHLECPQCGYIPHCKHCDVTLTYHKKSNNLRCHYCGFAIAVTNTCPQCGHNTLEMKGFGTEKVEDELKQYFPNAKIVRLDHDSTRNKNAHNQIIDDFQNGRTNILVGTQMVTKGLDFDNVNLVGVLNADNMLNFPDFRAYERTFQLLMQVSGRAGRKKEQGLVLIQTRNPQHDIFKYLKNNDYNSLIERLIVERKKFFYPPWSRLIKIGIQHHNQDFLDMASAQFATILRKHISIPIYGPEYALITKLKNKFRKEITIKLPINKNLELYKQQILIAIQETRTLKNYSSLTFVLDVDNY